MSDTSNALNSLKPYARMKDSSVPWLMKVPEHWEVRRLHNIATMIVSNADRHKVEDEQPVRLCNYVNAYKHDSIRIKLLFMSATAFREEIQAHILVLGWNTGGLLKQIMVKVSP